MKLEQIEKDSIQNYSLNMQYLKNNHKKLYEKINLFEIALNTNLINSKYELSYKDGYFDILDLETNKYFYNQNSEDYGKSIVKNQLDFNPKSSSFKTFYEARFNDEIADAAKNTTVFSSSSIGNAPIIHYVNTNLPNQETMKTIPKMILFGVGLGTHIPHLHRETKSKLYLIVEPNLELFRLSLFNFKYYNLERTSKLIFSIAENENEFIRSFDDFYGVGFIYNHYLKHFMFSKNCDMYVNLIQNKLVSQWHLTYDYARIIEGLERTVSCVNNDYNILDITPFQLKEIETKPVLLLAAGPSLQRNIEFVKKNQDKYIIVALYVLLPFLEKHNIRPDFITQYDQAGEAVLKTIREVNDINFFKNAIFIFSSHVNKKVIDTFPKENMFIFQAMHDIKKDFKFQTSPSIGEISYALLLRLGAKEIYLLGLDMAMDAETNKTHIDEHQHSKSEFKKVKNNSFTLSKDIVKVKGNFRESVDTLAVFKLSIVALNKINEILLRKDVNVYNLSDGAFFNNTISLKIEDIKEEKFVLLKKEELIQSLHQGLINISEKGFNKKDKEIIKQKIEDAYLLKSDIESFFKIKDSNVIIYEDRLGKFINNLRNNKYSSFELKEILYNYILHNVHYIYHFINMEYLSNPKKHLKSINKILYKQIIKFVDNYIEIYK